VGSVDGDLHVALASLLLEGINSGGEHRLDRRLVVLPAPQAHLGLIELDESLQLFFGFGQSNQSSVPAAQREHKLAAWGRMKMAGHFQCRPRILGGGKYLEDELLEEALVLLAGLAELGEAVLGALLEVNDNVLTGLEHSEASLVELVRVRTSAHEDASRPRILIN
jgi:hypothetical protein